MQRFADEFGADVQIDSAGTHGYHVGEPADARMQNAAEARGYELTSKARKVTAEDLLPERFDLVLAMDADNHAILVEMAGGIKPHIRLFSDYLDGDQWPRDVPDPYYGEEDGFDQVLDMLEEGCPTILETLVGGELFGAEFTDDTM